MHRTRPRAFALAAAAALCAALLGADGARAQDTVGSGPDKRPQPEGGGPGTGGGRVDYTRPFRTTEVTAKAVLFSKPEPGYTEEARAKGVDGVVRLRAVLSSTGEVTNISVVKGLPGGLTEKAIAAARRIRFRPAQKDGRAVSQWVTLEYNFNIYYDEGEVAHKAVITDQPRHLYTEAARAHRVEGTVVLEVALSKHGRASVVRVVSGLPHGLTESAAEAVGGIKFTPARDKGRPVSVLRRMEFVFKLD